jgi:Bacterial PH domain
MDDTKPCPVCGETIKAVALKCRFCNTDLQTFAENQEFEAESELFSGRPALIYSIGQFAPFLIAIAVCAILGYSGIGMGYVVTGFAVLCIAIGLRLYIARWSLMFHITTQRIKVEHGLLSKVQESLELFRIDHFELRKPLGQRLLGQASLHIFSSDAEMQRFYLYGIPHLEPLAEKLRNCQLRERKRRGLSTFVRA